MTPGASANPTTSYSVVERLTLPAALLPTDLVLVHALGGASDGAPVSKLVVILVVIVHPAFASLLPGV